MVNLHNQEQYTQKKNNYPYHIIVRVENINTLTTYYFAAMVLENECVKRNPDEIDISIIILARSFSVSSSVYYCSLLLPNLRRVPII